MLQTNLNRSHYFRKHLLCLLAICCLVCASAQAKDNSARRIGVLFPEVGDAYSYFFESIIAGIDDNSDYEIVKLKTNEQTTKHEVIEWSKRQSIDAFIALGQLSYNLAHNSNHGLPVIAGGLVASPNGITGISLTGDPASFFTELKKLAPRTKRVHIVYNEKNTGWLIQKALSVTGKFNIGLVTYAAEDVVSATQFYRNILDNARSEEDAIWIPLDNIAPMNTLLPDILQKAWHRKLVVFSNNLQHTMRGTLFSLYPDHHLLGKRLVEMAADSLNLQIKQPLLLSSNDLKVAVNVRTASHLGLNITPQKMDIDLVYPSFK
jgi:putative ABC transport system substrate-binding protein